MHSTARSKKKAPAKRDVKHGGRPTLKVQMKAKAANEVSAGVQKTIMSFFSGARLENHGTLNITCVQQSQPQGTEEEEEQTAVEDDADLMDVEIESNDDAASAVSTSSRKRMTYDVKDRQSVLELLQQNEGNKKKTVAIVNKVPGFENVRRQHLRRWETASYPKRKCGRPVNVEFEQDVLSNLVMTVVKAEGKQKTLVEIANVAYSYSVVKIAAQLARASPAWKGVEEVSKLKFTNSWIHGFLQRNVLRRRRITTTAKARPTVDDIQSHMARIQAKITEGGYQPYQVVNSDETGVFFGAAPLCQYVGPDQSRGIAPAGGNGKARFTAVLFSSADGKMGPPFVIVKCAVQKPDLSSVRILCKLKRTSRLFETDAWELRVWRRSLPVTVTGKTTTVEYVRPYLQNQNTKATVTVHSRAWMDAAGMTMWADVLLGPLWQREPHLIVWDNCSSHTVPAVIDVFKSWNIEVQPLPKNTTDILQVHSFCCSCSFLSNIH
jgi:hypothetical protein